MMNIFLIKAKFSRIKHL